MICKKTTVARTRRLTKFRWRFLLGFVLALLVSLGAVNARAQSPLDGFNPDVNDAIRAIAVQPDGKILIGGDFTQVGGQVRSYLARLHADGTLDTGFTPSVDAPVHAIALLPNNYTLIGGEFSGYLARLNSIGFEAGLLQKPNGPVYAIAVDDQFFFVGGDFTAVGGQARHYMFAQYFSGETIYMHGGFKSELDAPVRAIAAQPDGAILIGGDFTEADGVAHSRLARFHSYGVLDQSFTPDADDTVHTVAVQANGKIIVGGEFENVNGLSHSNLVRLNPSGAVDESFTTDTNDSVAAITIQADGRILIGGEFTTADGLPRGHLARLFPNGSVDPGFETAANDDVMATAILSDNRIVIGGGFSQIGGVARNHIARLYADGSVDDLFNPSINNKVFALAKQPDDKILIGGEFTQVGGLTRNRVARLSPSGALDAFDPNVGNGQVYGMTVQDDGKVLVGGSFTLMGGQTRNKLARLNADGSLDMAFNPNADNWIRPIVVQADGKILIGGHFENIAGGARDYIARLNPNGTLDTGFSPSATAQVFAVAVQGYDMRILVGGAFHQIDGVDRRRIARLDPDGNLDTDFNPVANNSVYAIAVQADGKILVGGTFTQIGTQTRNHIARLDLDGSLDLTFDPNVNGAVHAISIQADRSILLVGEFTQVGGQTRNRIARLNSDGSLDMNFNANANDKVYALALQSDGKIVVGGSFVSVNGELRSNIARLTNTTPVLTAFLVDPLGASLEWESTTTTPDPWHVTLDWLPPDNMQSRVADNDFQPLGEGQRTSDGWELTGLDLPRGEDFLVRVRGYYGTGMSNGSGSIVESTYSVYLPSPTGPITFTKQIVGGDSTADDWRFNLVDGPGDIAPSIPISIPVGSYVVEEVGPPDYQLTGVSGVCSLEENDVVLTVTELGGTCTLTNTLPVTPTAVITITKQVEGGEATADEWRFDLVGGPTDISSGEPVTITLGQHIVSEHGPAGYTLSDVGGICEIQDGQVMLSADEEGGECIIVNTLDDVLKPIYLPYMTK